jgi:histidine triad (HIT) family protein
MNMECIFCKIINKEIEAKILYEDDVILAFEDIAPQAPVHVLVVPKRHVANLAELPLKKEPYLAESLLGAINEVTKKYNLNTKGYRVVVNCGRDAGQEVPHLHFHLLGGRKFTWPPG